MDPTTLAQNLTTFLAPFLPYLLKAGKEAGKKAVEKIGEKFGAGAWEKAQALWGKLRGNKAVEKAAQDAVAMPDDPDSQAALRLQLKKLLAQDEALTAELNQLWQEAEEPGVTVTAIGDRSVATQRMEDSIVVTGDRNAV